MMRRGYPPGPRGVGGVAVKRRRTIPFQGWASGRYYSEWRFNGGAIHPYVPESGIIPAEPAKAWYGLQETESENHPEWRDSNRGSGDLGGAFYTSKRSVYCADVSNRRFTTRWRPWSEIGPGYEKRVVVDTPYHIPYFTDLLAKSPTAESDNMTLAAMGTKAIANCAPTQPTVNLAASLLELVHDGLPKLVGKEFWESNTRRASSLRNNAKVGSSEWLNYQFGQVPLMSDIFSFMETVWRLDELINQFLRDNGKVVRRKWSFPPEFSVVETVVDANAFPRGPDNVPGLFLFNELPSTQLVRRRETMVRRWFSGAFVYHLPWTVFRDLYYTHESNWQELRQMFGLDLTLDTIWQVTPWSWLVDWFTNAGDVLSNASTWEANGLVMKYGYIMEHSFVRDTYTYVGPIHIDVDGVVPRPPDVVVTNETKKRLKASPFGFGLTFEGLSLKQKSILTALSLGRVL